MHCTVPLDSGKVPLPGFKTKIVKHLSLKSFGFLVQNPETFEIHKTRKVSSIFIELLFCKYLYQVVKFGSNYWENRRTHFQNCVFLSILTPLIDISQFTRSSNFLNSHLNFHLITGLICCQNTEHVINQMTFRSVGKEAGGQSTLN